MNLAKKALPFIIILLLLIVIKNNVTFLMNHASSGSALSKLEEDLQDKKKKNQFLKEKLYYVKTDKFVADQAQNKLGMLKDGEYFVIAPTASPQQSENPIINNEPNWKKWWNLFF